MDMGKNKHKRQTLGQIEAVELVSKPVAEIQIPDVAIQCDSCHATNLERRYVHWSAPGKPLCARCYNIVVKQHTPPSEW